MHEITAQYPQVLNPDQQRVVEMILESISQEKAAVLKNMLEDSHLTADNDFPSKLSSLLILIINLEKMGEEGERLKDLVGKNFDKPNKQFVTSLYLSAINKLDITN